MSISVVIPAYNEENDIEEALHEVYKVFPLGEVIVVNDASTDNTLKILERFGSKLKILTNEKNMGHGYSVVRGLKEATGDYILYIDADRQIHIPGGFPTVFDFYSGQRWQRKDKAFRKVVSFCLRMTILFRHRMYIKDSNCPFKIYRREAVQGLLNKLPKTYIIPIAELEVLARKAGYKILVVPMMHYPYQGVRKGFLQAMNKQFFLFLYKAFKEVVSL